MKNLNNLGRIVLASNSPRRKDILKKINLDFKVIPSNIIEDFDKTNPSTHVQTCAFEKAKKVSLENLNNFSHDEPSVAFLLTQSIKNLQRTADFDVKINKFRERLLNISLNQFSIITDILIKITLL